MDGNGIKHGTGDLVNVMLEEDMKENMKGVKDEADPGSSNTNTNYSKKYAGFMKHLHSHV